MQQRRGTRDRQGIAAEVDPDTTFQTRAYIRRFARLERIGFFVDSNVVNLLGSESGKQQFRRLSESALVGRLLLGLHGVRGRSAQGLCQVCNGACVAKY